MAPASQLTPRQKEIKKLKDEGKTVAQIAKKLKITVNAVYQQQRRMRNGNKPAAAKKGNGRRASSRRRSSAGSSPRVQPARPVIEAVTPLDAVRNRRAEIDADLRLAEIERQEAEKAAATAAETHAKLAKANEAELSQLDAAEAALTGKVRRAAPKRSSARRSGRKATGKGKGRGSRAGGSQRPQTASPNGASGDRHLEPVS